MNRIISALIAAAALFPGQRDAALAQEATAALRVVDVGGVTTRAKAFGLESRAAGEPVVVFQSGLGSPIESWNGVVEAVSQFAPVVAYDRPGIAGSEPYSGGETPTFDRTNRHLRELLAALDAPPPYVLVGHSLGGPLIQRYAGEFPDEVAGLVFVDPSDWTDPDFAMNRDELAELGYHGDQQDSVIAQIERFMDSLYEQAPPGIAAEWRMIRQFMAVPVGERGMSGPLEVPTAFLLSGRVEPPPPGAPDVFSRPLVQGQQAMRVSRFLPLIEGLPEATLVIAMHAGHYIHADDPDLVVEAIHRVTFPSLRPQLARALDQGGTSALREKLDELKQRYPGAYFNEGQLNALGYDLLSAGRLTDAVAVFELNVAEYPDASNPWDSLGEAYMMNGDREKAIESYQRSLALDPTNENAVAMLHRLSQDERE